MPFEVERILDANANRMTEGLRVIEDYLRFSDSKSDDLLVLKELRHKVVTILKDTNLELVQNRFASRDKGREIKGDNEYKRESEQDLIRSNFKRAQESCRVIEETLKSKDQHAAQKFEELRYQLYDIEQLILYCKPFPKNCLYALVTQSLCKLDPLDVVKMIRDGGADIIQLREKEMEDRKFLEWASTVKSALEGSEVSLIINDKLHIAQLIDATGVHLGQGDLKIEDAKKILKPWQWVGRSTSQIESAQKAYEEGHTYIGVGPLFPTNTKLHRKAVGIEYIEEVNENCEIPYVSIGSIKRDNIDLILKAKPRGIAVCTGLISADDPKTETRYFKEKIARLN
jgi:thiamine-phosphate pyrophosphorylase